MKLTKTLKLSLNMLLHSKLRSWLTVIGIVIGVAAVVSIVSIGQGLQQSVQNQIGSLGQDILTISVGGGRAVGGFGGGGGGGEAFTSSSSQNSTVNPLSTQEVNALKLVSGIEYIYPVVSGRTSVYYNAEQSSVSISGGDTNLFSQFVESTLSSGRTFSPGETGEAVVGYRVATSVFKEPLQVGYILRVNGLPFKIVGILSSASGIGSSDGNIYLSEKDARTVLASSLGLTNNQYSSIQVKVTDVNLESQIQNDSTSSLINVRHTRADRADFTITSPLALQERITSVTSSITLFLSLLAAVSLLVGGIGVANTMFTSVLEKTRDIGVMKAIGAKNRDILLLFLFNSGMLGLVGGIIGVAVGAGISLLLPSLGLSISLGGGRGAGGQLSTVLNPALLIFALAFSTVIGMLSGAIPAYRASKLKPVEALRYE
jgi:putative ABC transport system permease protein